MAQRALKLFQQTPHCYNWSRALIRLAEAYGTRGDRGNIKQGIALLDYWLPQVDPQQVDYTAWGRATRARLLSRLGYQEAVPLTREAVQLAKRCDGASEAEYRTLDYAEALLNLGKPEEARDAVTTLETDNPAVTLMQSRILHALGHHAESMEWLVRAKRSFDLYFSSNAHQIPYFSSQIQALEEIHKIF